MLFGYELHHRHWNRFAHFAEALIRFTVLVGWIV
jgi:hypothetical protein